MQEGKTSPEPARGTQLRVPAHPAGTATAAGGPEGGPEDGPAAQARPGRHLFVRPPAARAPCLPFSFPSPPAAPRLTFMRSKFLDSFVFTSPAMAAAALALGRAGSPSSSTAAAAQAGGEPGEEAAAARLGSTLRDQGRAQPRGAAGPAGAVRGHGWCKSSD